MTRLLLPVTLAAMTLLGIWLTNARLAERQAAGGGAPNSTRSAALDPYDTPVLQGYRTYRDALMSRDFGALAELAEGDDSYLAYRSALTLGRAAELAPADRYRHYRRAAELRIVEPLARQENREFQLELATIAEAAGETEAAIDGYAAALPAPQAISALKRLESDPYRLANRFFRARLSREALNALDGRTAPSIEAPSYQRLGQHQDALLAYENWLVEQPESLDARYGRAWAHYYLGNLSTAYSLFVTLEGSSSIYGRALIARRQGNLGEAVELVRQSGEPSHLWLGSSWLEAEDRHAEALALYLQLARLGSSYSDDAAYRAIVLARRLGDSEGEAEARRLLPEGSFFALRLDGAPLLPDRAGLPAVELEVQKLATALARVNDFEAAIGELSFALRDAEDEAVTVALAESLQLMGEFRQSQRAAQRFVDAGSRELRTWRAAYPRAYPDLVEGESQQQGIEPELVWAIMRQESAFYPQAVSVANAAGLMQVIPSTWDWLAELQEEEPGDRFDPAANIRYGSYYLRWLMDYHDGDAELVITSYNRGQGYIRRLFEGPLVNGDKDDFYREIDAFETREYLQRVMVNYRTYRALYGGAPLADAGGEEGETEAR